MAVIAKPNNDKLNPMGNCNVPAMELPSFRLLLGQQNKTLKNILIRSPFALGDCVCAEPAIRFAQKHFKGSTISLVTPFPEIFRHIPNIRKVYSPQDKPNWDEYFVIDCYHPADALQSEFVHNFNMAIDDYIAVSLFKGQIPVSDRNIVLQPTQIEEMPSFPVVLHAGKHWISKTFPKKWWDAVIHHLLARGIKPVLIGADMEGGKRGFVDVDATHCHDFRNKMTVMQSVSLLQKAQVVLTNDSAPHHMAASGGAHIGVFSTVRHIDFIGHWRTPRGSLPAGNQWNHQITDLALGCMWKREDVSPSKNGGKYDVIDHGTLMSWLPEPEAVADWTQSKLLAHIVKSSGRPPALPLSTNGRT